MEIDKQEYEQFLAWKEEQSKHEKNIATVTAVLAAEADADTEAFFAPFHPDATFWMNGNTAASGTREGLAAMKTLFESFMEQLPSGLTQTVTHVLAAGDWVVTECVGQSRTLDGKAYNGTYVQLWKFRDARIVEFREYLDTKLMADTFSF